MDEYIASFPEETQAKLRELRATIEAAAPEAEEKISYGMPGFFAEGQSGVFRGVEEAHWVLCDSERERGVQDELSAYTVSKGAVQFPLDQPLPVDLITRMVSFGWRRTWRGRGEGAQERGVIRQAVNGGMDGRAERAIRWMSRRHLDT